MSNIILYAILGIGGGTAYVLLGLGVVAIHKGSGVVNFAQGAIALVAATIMVELDSIGIPLVVAAILAIVAAAVLGAIIYFAVMRPLRNAPTLARNVATLGVMVVLLTGTILFFGSISSLSVPELLPSNAISLFGLKFGSDRMYLLIIGIVAMILLTLLYKFTRFGLATRAVSENELGASLLGFSPTLIASGNWIIGGALAGAAGVLVAPITGVDPTTLTFLVVPTLAVALVGGFSSFGATLIAGLVLGVVQSEAQLFAPNVSGISELVPFLAIVLVMVLRNKAIPSRDILIQGRPPTALAGKFRWWYVVIPAVFVISLLVYPYLSAPYVLALQTSMCFGVIFLSQTIVTGFAGQISLAQLTFAGVGVLLTSFLSTTLALPFPLPVIIAGIVAFPIGAIVGLPAVRVRGINLAVLTLGLATAVYTFIFGNSALTGGQGLSQVGDPSIFGLDLDAAVYPERFLAAAFVVVVLAAIAVTAIRRSRLGRRFLAVRENERAAAANGVNVTRTKLLAFSIAASLAAVGGAMIAYQSSTITYDSFQASSSVSLISGSYILGVGSVLGALIAGLVGPGGLLSTFLANAFTATASQWLPFIMGILLILTVVTNPDGVVPYFVAQSAKRRERRNARTASGPTPNTGTEANPKPIELINAPSDTQKVS